MSKAQFANDEYYHIYNRGVDKRKVFLDAKDYERFLLSIKEFNVIEPIGSIFENSFRKKDRTANALGHPMSKLVEVICYCLNPNHFHFIIKQKSEKGIEKFMQKLGNGYTKYFNLKYQRNGVLFQGRYKAIHISSNEYLLYLSAYVNRNNFIHGYSSDGRWPYTSYLDYINKKNGGLCNKEVILDQFKNTNDYKKFVHANAVYLKSKKEEDKFLLE